MFLLIFTFYCIFYYLTCFEHHMLWCFSFSSLVYSAEMFPHSMLTDMACSCISQQVRMLMIHTGDFHLLEIWLPLPQNLLWYSASIIMISWESWKENETHTYKRCVIPGEWNSDCYASHNLQRYLIPQYLLKQSALLLHGSEKQTLSCCMGEGKWKGTHSCVVNGNSQDSWQLARKNGYQIEEF